MHRRLVAPSRTASLSSPWRSPSPPSSRAAPPPGPPLHVRHPARSSARAYSPYARVSPYWHAGNPPVAVLPQVRPARSGTGRALPRHHQCFTTIDRGSFAASPCAASSDSAEAISASRPSTACRYRTTRPGRHAQQPHQILGRRAGRGRHRLPSMPKIMKPEPRHAYLPPCTVERLAYSIAQHWAASRPTNTRSGPAQLAMCSVRTGRPSPDRAASSAILLFRCLRTEVRRRA